MIYWILAIIFGVATGVGFALMVVGLLVKQSNDRGNSKGSMEHFTRSNPMRFLNCADRVKWF